MFLSFIVDLKPLIEEVNNEISPQRCEEGVEAEEAEEAQTGGFG